MGEKQAVTFYNPKNLVLGEKRVTLRLAREEDDKYNNFDAGDSFVLNIN